MFNHLSGYRVDRYHYVTIFLVCETDEEPVNKEPEKCVGWEWISWVCLVPNWEGRLDDLMADAVK